MRTAVHRASEVTIGVAEAAETASAAETDSAAIVRAAGIAAGSPAVAIAARAKPTRKKRGSPRHSRTRPIAYKEPMCERFKVTLG